MPAYGGKGWAGSLNKCSDMENTHDIDAARACLKEATELVAKGAQERVIQQRFEAHLQRMFPNLPWWVEYHGRGAEAHVKFAKHGKASSGFVDALVGLTVIEYEKDLSKPTLFGHGLDQVKDYCAGMLNSKHPADLIIGILSDTVRWHAYRISSITAPDVTGVYGKSNVELEQIEALNLATPDDRSGLQLIEFLQRYLGREGARPLGAETLAFDLGFESAFCDRHVLAIRELVDGAFASNTKYAALIEKLWRDFVAYLGDNGVAGGFDRDVYVRELYLLTLAKLLCANVIEKKALTSSDAEIRDILDGEHFKLKGLLNLVEYDYFGWLNEYPHVDALIPVAKGIQDDLRAYDFRSAPAEDLFGATMAQLAKRSQRLLLGQEWTPAWLAAELVSKTLQGIPANEDPRLVDMCCGSGAMVVEAVKLSIQRLDSSGSPHDATYVTRLTHAITGFDIDPLAVMLAKVGWVVAARDALEPFGTFPVSIPIYHADSLFAATPLSKCVDEETGSGQYRLVLDDRAVALPSFLVSPEFRALFDGLIDNAYTVAMESAKEPSPTVTAKTLTEILKVSETNSGITLVEEQKVAALGFCGELTDALDALQRDGRNGIWAFVLRNSYRPGLVAGLFNGLVSNPPWLALSKIADNPYKAALRKRAENYGIKPPGPSHLHIELATIFLLHAVERYLRPSGSIGCVLPETVLSGHHHNPFRAGAFLNGSKPVPLSVDELWRVEKGTFKNEAIVLFGKKIARGTLAPSPIPGQLVSPSGKTSSFFNKVEQGNRIAWSDRTPSGSGAVGFFQPAEFRQGADIMPRTLIFHETAPSASGQWSLGPINRQTSQIRYLVSDAKKLKDFALPSCVVTDRFVFDVLMSNHLTPFDVVRPAKGLLPIEKADDGRWVPVPDTSIATSAATRAIFAKVFNALGTTVKSADYFAMLDSNRRKLTSQMLPEEGWIVFMGAGGDYVCAAYEDAASYKAGKLVVDQTLYWTAVGSEDEAAYLVGLLNSEAVNDVIKEFQPRGQFGARHVHTLPVGVTPKFDPDDAAHADVVVKTRSLLTQWSNAKANPAVAEMLDPNKSLAQRRRKLRQAIQALPAYADYAMACRNLYGV